MNLHKTLRIAAGVAGALILATSTTPASATDIAGPPADAGATATQAKAWNSSVPHTYEVDLHEGDYESLISAYVLADERVWISATVTIDGHTFENAGLRLVGDSAPRGLDEGLAAGPDSFAWEIRLDKYVAGQSLDGESDFTIRAADASGADATYAAA